MLGHQHPAGARPPLGIDTVPTGAVGGAAGSRGARSPGLSDRGRARCDLDAAAAGGRRLCQRARNGARLLGDGHGQPQPARHDDLARPACDAGSGNRQRGDHAGRADHAVADLRHGADHRRHRCRHACRRKVALNLKNGAGFMLRLPRVEAILLSLRILAAYTASLTNNNREVTMLRRVLALSLLMAGMFSAAAAAQELMTEKKTLELPSFTTAGGKTIRNMRVGWESYGQLNADKSNAILITHFFSGTSHAAGKYKADEKVPGYWDPIIGPGKAL